MPVIEPKLEEEKPRHRSHRHHHHHHLPHHRTSHEKSASFSVSPLGGNRPFTVSEPTKVTAKTSVGSISDRHSRSRRSSVSVDVVSVSSSSSDSKSRSRVHSSEKSSRHRSQSRKPMPRRKSRGAESGSEDRISRRTARMHGEVPPENHTSPRIRKTSSSIGNNYPPEPRRRKAETINGSSAMPHITQTPPTPSRTPLEEAKRRNTLNFADLSIDGGVRLPYPSTPPSSKTLDSGTDYLAYHPRSSVDDIPASLRPGPGPGFGPVESHANAVEIGSSDSIPRAPQTRSRANSAASAPKPAIRRPTVKEDPYDFLKEFHTVFVVDDSASMDGGDLQRWNETRQALEVIAKVATKYDSDGIDIHFLNNPSYDAYSVTSASAIRRLFALVQPEGCTPTGRVLDEILRDYIDSYVRSKRPAYTNELSTSPSSSSDMSSSPSFSRAIKPLNIVVLTDGEPTDDPESVIVDAARQLERLNAPLHQVGIQFFQIGDEPGAREALQDLDDAISGVYNIRDMVDTTPFNGETVTGEMILKVLLGGINRRVDRKKN